ncbi:MAG: 1-acyl-sn-glycerol-3-phosphate acyltransferase [Bacillaceae bacterium]|nr:1-acyl-sn-glycerol-3-phosphate acyltransferase [Bacillaceae bacterium]
MIEPDKRSSFSRLFSIYNSWLLRRSFHRIGWLAKEEFPDSPVLYVMNHSSWWDGLLAFQLNQALIKQDSYVMMHEQGLRKYPFFRKLGAFSVNRQNPGDVLRSLTFAENLLKGGKSLWLFPQGDEFHLEKRPLNFLMGAMYLLEKCPDVPVVPISIYYSFGHNRKPEVYLLAGNQKFWSAFNGCTRKEKTLALEMDFTAQLDELKGYVVAEELQLFSSLL